MERRVYIFETVYVHVHVVKSICAKWNDYNRYAKVCLNFAWIVWVKVFIQMMFVVKNKIARNVL